MTLKAAWITPLGPRGPFTLTLESEGIEGPDRLPVHEMVFPETPADAPKRHTVALAAMTEEDLDLLSELLLRSIGAGGGLFRGFRQAKVTKEDLS